MEMGKIPAELRENIARNIRECRSRAFPGRGGGKRCAEAFGVTPQQWSPWERGLRTPDEVRLARIAELFGVTVEYLRRDNRVDVQTGAREPGQPSGSLYNEARAAANREERRNNTAEAGADDDRRIVYVPVLVLTPFLPDGLKALSDQVAALLNGERRHG